MRLAFCGIDPPALPSTIIHGFPFMIPKSFILKSASLRLFWANTLLGPRIRKVLSQIITPVEASVLS